MSKAVGSAVVITLSLGTIFYWFGLREPIDVEPASLSSVPQSSHSADSEERYCLQRAGKHDVEISIRTDCEQAGDAGPTDTLGLAIESREGRRVVTGYDL